MQEKKRIVRLVAVFVVVLIAAGIAIFLYESPTKSGTTAPSPQGNCASADASDGFQETISLPFGVAEADLWNLKTATGYVEQCYQNGLTTFISLNKMSLVNSDYFVAGYPEIAFGHNYADEEFSNSDNAPIRFPVQLQTLYQSDLWTNVSYSISSNHPSQMDFAYDLWVKNSTQIGAPTSEDYEVMIEPVDTYFYLATPPSAILSNETAIVNGVNQKSSWNMYTFPQGGTKAKLIIFSLSSPKQALNRIISLKPQDFISFASSSMGYNISESYWLMGIELGSEFYPLPTNTQPSWSWTVSWLSVATDSTDVIIVH